MKLLPLQTPILTTASSFSPAEILAMVELGCQHITISAAVLQALQDTPETLPPVTAEKPKHPYATLVTPERLRGLSSKDGLAGPDWDGVFATMETDFLADGGAKLDEFIRNDPIVSKRLEDATNFFLGMEDKARQVIEHKIAALGLKCRN